MKTRTKTRDEDLDRELESRSKAPPVNSENEILLRDLVSAFVQFPNGVRIGHVAHEDGGETLMLKVRPEDEPRVRGKYELHIQALRTIFEFIGARERRRMILLFDESPERANTSPPQRFTPCVDWDSAPTVALLSRVLRRVLQKEFTIEAYSPTARALERAGLWSGASSSLETRIDVTPDAEEQQLCTMLTEYLKPIFHAIGKNQGREVKLECKTDTAEPK